MSLATIKFSNGSSVHFEDGRWTGNDASLVAQANDFFPSPCYIPKSIPNSAVMIAGLATELAAKLGGRVVYPYSLNSARSQSHDPRATSPTHSVILASIEFPGGAQIHLGGDGRWTGDDAVFVAMANAYERSPEYYPNFAQGLATEIANLFGGKVIYVKKLSNEMPPGASY